MAHKKAGGSSRNGRDSKGRRLGLKLFGGQIAIPGNIIARQRGTTWHPGANVGIGKDHTLFALTDGRVEFKTKAKGRTLHLRRTDDGGCGRVNGESLDRGPPVHSRTRGTAKGSKFEGETGEPAPPQTFSKGA